jgi:hypothetical protein
MTQGLPGLLAILVLMLAPAGAWSADEPSEQPGERRRPLKELIYGATPEERERLAEERRRLSAMAAAFGTDPTAIIGYYQLAYQRNAYTNNLNADAAVAVVQVPITPNWFVRATLPYVRADPNQPAGSTGHGTGDTVARMAGRLYASENVVLLIGADASFPTASKTQLGTGKYTLGPGGALAFPLPRARSLFYTLVQDFNSVGGDPSRDHIHYMQVQPTFNTIWSRQWWTSIVADFNIDWTHRRKTTTNLQGQIGYQFGRNWVAFAGAGAGAMGRDTPLGYDWTVNAGIRWVFKTPLLPETIFGEPLGK